MLKKQPKAMQQRVKSLATESLRQLDLSGWFETLYTNGTKISVGLEHKPLVKR